mgnify:CR=1 FL=1
MILLEASGGPDGIGRVWKVNDALSMGLEKSIDEATSHFELGATLHEELPSMIRGLIGDMQEIERTENQLQKLLGDFKPIYRFWDKPEEARKPQGKAMQLFVKTEFFLETWRFEDLETWRH